MLNCTKDIIISFNCTKFKIVKKDGQWDMQVNFQKNKSEFAACLRCVYIIFRIILYIFRFDNFGLGSLPERKYQRPFEGQDDQIKDD